MNEKRKSALFFIISLIILAVFVSFLIPRQLKKRMAFFWSNNYYYIVYFALIFAFIILFLSLSKKFNIKDNTLKVIYGLIFLPVALFPAVRCYFRIPYIFCKACPQKCPWGELAPVMLPSFVLLNIDRRFWCFKLCPFGTSQDHQCKISKVRIKLPKWLSNIRYLFLLFTIIVVISLLINPEFYFGMFKGEHHFSLIGFGVVIIIFLLAFFIPRFWCNYICPIGSFGDLVLKIGNKLKNKFK